MYKWQLNYFLFDFSDKNILYASISPWFVTGLVDGEGSFSFSVYKNESSRLGWRISPRFNITMSIRAVSVKQQLY